MGAGISGIGAACHLRQKCPGKSFAVLEARSDIGGTWDLFRYPGIRSDSDMYTLGYGFKAWTAPKAIADAADIMAYLRETVAEHHIDQHIRYQHKVKSASWSSEANRWTLLVACGDEQAPLQITCNFLFMCSGYYNYQAAYTPDFAGTEQFRGELVHPQFWPDDIDYAGKKVVVIGSGATAVTLVPAMAEKAAHVTMLQRTPSYVFSRPAIDPFVTRLRRYLPERWVYPLVRWKNVLQGMFLFWFARTYPQRVKAKIIDAVREQLGPGFDVDRHFSPGYKPWDQRICLVPDADLFNSLRNGKASVVTDHIERFTEQGLLLKSGETLEAELVITATGLDMKLGGGVEITVDGHLVDQHDCWTYKGMMLSDIPNFAFSMGYTNASWTLKVDLCCKYFCRMLNFMERHGYQRFVPRNTDPAMEEVRLVDFSSGYIERALAHLPRQGSRFPWKLPQNYLFDMLVLGFGRIRDKAMEFK
jgi:cation diffusion facilitator CzcD-associated flavoprotein CzcO